MRQIEPSLPFMIDSNPQISYFLCQEERWPSG